MKHLNITISGRVQGVWFRKYTHDKAIKLGISGFVRNQPNSDVYVEAEAEQEALDKFIAWCHSGSPLSSVKKVVWQEDELKNFIGFEIER